MRWSERQLGMLREMGVRLWLPPDAVPAPEVAERLQPASAAPASSAAGGASASTFEAARVVRLTASAGLAAPAAHATTATPATPAVRAPAAVPGARAVPRAAPAVPEGWTPGPRASGVGAMDWPTLRAAVAGCTACKLSQGRTQTVFGVGHERAHWMIVGEAPGEQEDRQGEPFVGKSGQLLDNMLRAIGLTRGRGEADRDPARQVYIANAVKCRPPRNRNPEPEELACCEPFLVRQLQLLQPRIILAMGRFDPWKGFGALISAVKYLPGHAVLCLAGDGHAMADFKAQAASEGVADRVRFLGWRNDQAALLGACDLCVVSSFHEPLGNVILEAWSLKVPVVAAASEGPSWLITHGETGLLCEPQNPIDLAAKIRQAMENPVLRESLAGNGHAKWAGHFSKDTICRQYTAFFEDITTNRRSPSLPARMGRMLKGFALQHRRRPAHKDYQPQASVQH